MANSHSLDLETSSSQYASITDASQTGLDLTSDCSIEAWVKFETLPTTSTNTNYHIVNKYLSTGNNRSYFLSYANSDAAGAYQWWWATGSGSGVVIGNVADTNISTGVWYHIAMTYDASAGTAIIYKNGVQLGTMSSLNTSLYNGTADFCIGASGSGTSNFFDGIVDDVRVWSDIRTAQEISDNWVKELVGNEANLVGYWKLNNDYLDETSNNNDLTATNSPVFSTDVPFVGFTPVMFWY